MRFGLSPPHYGFSLPDGAPISFDAMASWARRAEALGFDSIWISDHFFYSFARYQGRAPPRSRRSNPHRQRGARDRYRACDWEPSSWAHRSGTRRSSPRWPRRSTDPGGRLDLGLGAGWLEEEFTAFGYRFGSVGKRFDSLEETLRVVRALFSGEPATLEGPTVTLRDARLLPRAPVRSGGIPIWVGGKGGASAAPARGCARGRMERRVAVGAGALRPEPPRPARHARRRT